MENIFCPVFHLIDYMHFKKSFFLDTPLGVQVGLNISHKSSTMKTGMNLPLSPKRKLNDLTC